MPDDTKAFEGLVQEKTGKKVLSAWKALFRGGGKVLSKSGLLCAVEGGLVFAEEKFGKPGLVAPFPAQGISSFRVEDSRSRVTLFLETESCTAEISGRDRASLYALLADAGLAKEAPAPPAAAEAFPGPAAARPARESGPGPAGPDAARARAEEDPDAIMKAWKRIEDLFDAVESGDAREVAALLDRGAPIEGRNNSGQTPLICACEEDETEVARLLIERGADCRACDEEGQTPLIEAADSENLECVRMLLARGADVNARNTSDGMSAVFLADDLDVLEALVSAGADVELRDDSGQTPLAVAARLGEDEKIQFLLEHGANPGVRDREGRSPFDLAVEEAEEVAAALLKAAAKGASPAASREVSDVRKRAKLAKELLSAVENGETEDVERLLDGGAPLECSDGEEQTPLILACRRERAGAARLLLARGADVEAVDDDGDTPLIHASGQGNAEIAGMLLGKGADPDARNKNGYSAIMFCEEIAVLEILASAGASVETPDNYGLTPLCHAASLGLDRKVQFLLEHGANPAATDGDGKTALENAREKGHEVAAAVIEAFAEGGGKMLSGKVDGLRKEKKLIRELLSVIGDGYEESAAALLDRGAPIDGRGNGGETPLMAACREGRPAIAKMLVDRGANVNARNEDGETALMHAVEQDDLECVRLLLDNGADPNIPNSTNGQSVLVFTRDAGILEALIRGGAEVDLADDSLETPLGCAARCGEEEKVRILLEHGADPARKDDMGRTPHDLAVNDGEKAAAAIIGKWMKKR